MQLSIGGGIAFVGFILLVVWVWPLRSVLVTAPRRIPSSISILSLLLVPTLLHAQLERIDVPAGILRVDGFVSLTNADERFNDGTTESILGPVSSPVTEAESEVNVGVMGIGLALGLLDRVTVFARVPLVRYRNRAVIRSDSVPEARQDTSISLMGDAELGASFTLADGWDQGERLGGFRAALGAMVRLPTGETKDPMDPLEPGTGSGQTDIALGAVADLGSGNLGIRFAAGYTIQLPGTVPRFVRSPMDPTDFTAPVANMRWTPGNILHLGARPFFRVARAFAFQLSASYRVKGEDRYEYASDADVVTGLDPAILSEGTASNVLLVGGGVSYSAPSASDPRATGLPVEAYWSYSRTIRSSKGLVPKGSDMSLGLRVYFGLWK